MSNYAEKVKTYHDNGWYTDGMLQKLVAKGKITEEEYEEITGDDE